MFENMDLVENTLGSAYAVCVAGIGGKIPGNHDAERERAQRPVEPVEVVIGDSW